MLKDQLRRARLAAGKTQQECADHLGVNYSTYSGYETGKRQPDALKIKKIAAFLNTTGDYLLETGFEQEAEQERKNGAVFCDSADERRLIQTYRLLNNAGKSAAISAIEGLSANPALREEGSNATTA